MRRVSRKPIGMVVVALVAAAVPLAPPAMAFHDDEVPVVHAETIDGPGWVAMRFSTDGAKVVFDVEAFGVRRPSQQGGVLYDEDEQRVYGFTSQALEGHTGVVVETHPAPGADLVVDEMQPVPERESGMVGYTFNDPELGGGLRVGTFTMLLWHAGDADQVTFTLRGAEGVTYDTSTSGSETFLYTAKDFRGHTTVRVGGSRLLPESQLGLLGARANLDTTLEMTTAGTMVGRFMAPFTTTSGVPQAYDEMHVDTPAGTVDCPCGFFDYEPGAQPFSAGDYAFHLTGAGVGHAEVLLGGAVVWLPDADAEESAESDPGAGGSSSTSAAMVGSPRMR